MTFLASPRWQFVRYAARKSAISSAAASLGKIFRTTAFKLSLAYLTIFAAGAGLVLGQLGWNIKVLLDQETRDSVAAEVQGLIEQYDEGGLGRLVKVIDARSHQPGASLYLLTTNAGQPIAGNVAVLPEAVIDQPGIVETRYERVGDPYRQHLAMARALVLSGGFRLMVGRDLEERERLRSVIVHALVTSLIYVAVIGMLGGLYVAWRVLRRVDGMTATARTIMAGDFSGRLPIAGSGDELDRLAQSLNAMLDRIAELMDGLKEVSDNIAHDLKTPLTRLRNRAEQALRTASEGPQYRQALESIIEESEGLIRIFNALLMIARAEAKTGREGMTDFDVGKVARDVVELFEPVAEQIGTHLSIVTEPNLSVHGNRELIGQAIANLVDNALKYGTVPGRAAAPATAALAEGTAASQGEVLASTPLDQTRACGQISVEVRRIKDAIAVSVADRGPGIAPQDRARARERFVRLENSRSRPGSGLGLSLVAAVAHLHDGELRMEDNEPGLRVVMALPVRGRAASTRAAATPAP